MHDMTLVIGKTRHQLMRTRAFFVYHVNCFNVFRKMGYMPPVPMLSGKQKPKSSMVSLYDWIVNYRSLYLQNKWYMFIRVQSSAIANFTFNINCTCSYGFNRRLLVILPSTWILHVHRGWVAVSCRDLWKSGTNSGGTNEFPFPYSSKQLSFKYFFFHWIRNSIYWSGSFPGPENAFDDI